MSNLQPGAGVPAAPYSAHSSAQPASPGAGRRRGRGHQAPPRLAWNRLLREIPWFCATWRGGCGTVIGDQHTLGEPCPHCDQHAVTRGKIIEPEPGAQANG